MVVFRVILFGILHGRLMSNTVKTAVSLDRKLLERAKAMAEMLHVTRSRVMTLALEEFIRSRENSQMLEQLNAVYGEPESQTDADARRGMKKLQRALTDGEW